MIFAIIVIVLMFAGLVVGVFMYLQLNHASNLRVVKGNIAVLNEEINKKKEVLDELGRLALGFIPKDEYDRTCEEVTKFEEQIRGEQAKVTITQAEFDAGEARLRELEEVDRELEASALEAAREIDMLRTQENDIRKRNAELVGQLNKIHNRVDQLIEELEHCQEAVDRMVKVKAELVEIQQKIEWYTEQTSVINQQFIDLKHAYDALDIEYAQLYDKHNAMLAEEEEEQNKRMR
ncbi:MAG: hypothetical protein IT291_07830 [Deltaproteobacteria bacterium]|nr:hypothetical protein [Deltaproteobacteria bacterium]